MISSSTASAPAASTSIRQGTGRRAFFGHRQEAGSSHWSEAQQEQLDQKKKGLKLPLVVLHEVFDWVPLEHLQPPKLKAIAEGNTRLTQELLSDRRLKPFATIADQYRLEEARSLWRQQHPNEWGMPQFLCGVVFQPYQQAAAQGTFEADVFRAVWKFGQMQQTFCHLREKQRMREEKRWGWSQGRRMQDECMARVFFERASDHGIRLAAPHLLGLHWPAGLSRLVQVAPDRLMNCLTSDFFNETGNWAPSSLAARNEAAKGLIRTKYEGIFESTLEKIFTQPEINPQSLIPPSSVKDGFLRRLFRPDKTTTSSSSVVDVPGLDRTERAYVAWASFRLGIPRLLLTEQILELVCKKYGVTAREVAAGEAELLMQLKDREMNDSRLVQWFQKNVSPWMRQAPTTEQEILQYAHMMTKNIRLERVHSTDTNAVVSYFEDLDPDHLKIIVFSEERLWPNVWEKHKLEDSLPVFLHYFQQRKNRLVSEQFDVDSAMSRPFLIERNQDDMTSRGNDEVR